MGVWWHWALVSPDGVAPSWMVGVSASVNLPLHHKVQKFSSGTGSPGWSVKKGRKTVVWCGSQINECQLHQTAITLAAGYLSCQLTIGNNCVMQSQETMYPGSTLS